MYVGCIWRQSKAGGDANADDDDDDDDDEEEVAIVLKSDSKGGKPMLRFTGGASSEPIQCVW